VIGRCFDGYGLEPVRIQSHATDAPRYGLEPVRIQSHATDAPTDRLFFLKVQPHVADHHQISDKTLAARILLTCLTRTVPHKICVAARTNVPLFPASKATRNPTTVVSDPSHNPHKQYCQLKMGNVKCPTLYYGMLLLLLVPVTIRQITSDSLLFRYLH